MATLEHTAGKSNSFRSLLIRLLLLGVFIIGVRFAYVIVIAGESCTVADFCFSSFHETLSLVIAGAGAAVKPLAVESTTAGGAASPARPEIYTSKEWTNAVRFYSSVLKHLIAGGYLSPASKSLCVETPTGRDVFTMREIGVKSTVGISRKAVKPLVKSGRGHRIPFPTRSFDFIFSGEGSLERSPFPAEFAAELVKVDYFGGGEDDSSDKCSVPEYKHDLVKNAEPLISMEPLKPWITLKRNLKNIKYLSSMVDISFKRRYVYVDVGARSYGSSIGSWFRKQYPKQNKTFHVYAIEADRTFHPEYALKKAVTLVPYAAWVKNETLTFEIHRDPGEQVEVKGRGMGRIQPLQGSSSEDFDGEVEKIKGFDFAAWLKNTVSKNDFVVMKMDVEGTEFDLIPRLFETGAICLVDEIFLECHYNRWQRCCPGQRSAKYEKTYDQCLQLFNSLRQSGVLVHQWW
ncbi:hypothetical protein Ahy_A06g029918 isoform E [Arachis hypogaea]|uniref:DUF7870 domain-containing protein n=1 Tax=Arachis hypogaea TaxID=3818 RepID=A0A445CUK8_ARAHY|nr:hypothetical protein Ahy_A06g029918 isoform E [Arachis hypogaea]